MKALITIVFVLFLAACGSGGESIETKSNLTPLFISIAGDSTAYKFPVSMLQSKLPVGSVVNNYGIGGLCTSEGYHFAHKIINETPKGGVILYFSGINDARRCGTSTVDFISLIDGMVKDANSQGKRFLPVTPNPTFSFENNMVDGYAIAERAAFDVFDLRLLLQTTALPFDYPYELHVDGTHMTPIIYEWMSSKIVEKLVK